MKKLLTSVLTAALTLSALTSMTGISAVVNSPDIRGVKVTASELSLDVYAEQVAQLVNERRAQNGVAPLKVLPLLNKAANIRAKEIVSNFDHVRPNGKRGYTAIEDAGLKWNACAENIAAGYPTPEAVVQGWMDSAGHRKNMLNPNYQYIGVGVCYSGGYYYWTQLFLGSSSEYTDAALPKIYGDINGDNMIDAVDASFALSDYALASSGKATKMDSNQKKLADLNGDGYVDAVDASIILNIYAKNSTK